MEEIGFHEIGGFRVGHAHDAEAATGCTVLLCDTCAPAGIDIRGGGPASRETPLLSPLAMADGVHALLLSGGSAFGLDASGGVMRYLEQMGVGLEMAGARVPIVPAAVLFDLGVGDSAVRPDALPRRAAPAGVA